MGEEVGKGGAEPVQGPQLAGFLMVKAALPAVMVLPDFRVPCQDGASYVGSSLGRLSGKGVRRAPGHKEK